jgi:hypothetical protein
MGTSIPQEHDATYFGSSEDGDSRFFQNSVPPYKTAQHRTPEDRDVDVHCPDNLEYQVGIPCPAPKQNFIVEIILVQEY